MSEWNPIKPDEAGEFIYHYTTAEKFAQIVMYQRLRLSPLTNANDPYEFLPWDVLKFGGSEPLNRHMASLYGEVNRWKDRSLFVSFSTDNKKLLSEYNDRYNPYGTQHIGRGFADSRMWAHYADKHSGVCLVFSKKALLADIEAAMDEGEIQDDGEIDYIDWIDIPTAFSDAFNALGTEKYASEYINNYKKTLFFTKHKEWESENEYRIILIPPTQIGSKMIPLSENTVKGVLFGVAFKFVLDRDYIRRSLGSEVRFDDMIWERGQRNIYSLP